MNRRNYGGNNSGGGGNYNSRFSSGGGGGVSPWQSGASPNRPEPLLGVGSHHSLLSQLASSSDPQLALASKLLSSILPVAGVR